MILFECGSICYIITFIRFYIFLRSLDRAYISYRVFSSRIRKYDGCGHSYGEFKPSRNHHRLLDDDHLL